MISFNILNICHKNVF